MSLQLIFPSHHSTEKGTEFNTQLTLLGFDLLMTKIKLTQIKWVKNS